MLSRNEAADAPGEIKAQGCRKEKEREEKRKMPPSSPLRLHSLPAHLNPPQLLKSLPGEAVAKESPQTLCRRHVFEFCVSLPGELECPSSELGRVELSSNHYCEQ